MTKKTYHIKYVMEVTNEVEANSESVMHDIQKPITLEDLTNPDNKK